MSGPDRDPHPTSLEPRHRPPGPRGDDSARAVAVMRAVLRAVAEREGFGGQHERLLGDLGGALEQPVAALWVPRGGHLTAHVTWWLPTAYSPALQRAFSVGRIGRGVGLTGRAWSTLVPTAGIGSDIGPRSVAEGPQREIRETVAVPCAHRREALAVLAFYGGERLWLSERLTEALTHAGRSLGSILACRRGELGLSPLTRREVDVLKLAAAGLSVDKLAEELMISRATVKTHLEHIYGKLEVHDRAAAVATAVRSGFIE